MSLKKVAEQSARVAGGGGGGGGVWKAICAVLVAIIAILLGIIFEDELAGWIERTASAAGGGDGTLLMRSLDPNGGWHVDEEAFIAYDCPCDIDHREDLTADSFFEEYYQKKPVIVPNLNVTQGARWYKLAKAFQKKDLLRDYGDLDVKAGTSRGIPQASGDGYERVPLREFLATMYDTENAIGDEPMYVFDKNTPVRLLRNHFFRL